LPYSIATLWQFLPVIIFIIFLPWLLRLYIIPSLKRKKLAIWLDSQLNRDKLLQALALAKELDKLSPYKQAAKIATKYTKKLGDSLTYGEIEPLSFLHALELTAPQIGENFVELGCGRGHNLILASMTQNFSRVIGIEILKPIYSFCLDNINNLKITTTRLDNINIVQADILKYDLRQANIVFFNATCFDNSTFSLLAEKFLTLPKGARIILTSHTLELTSFNLLATARYPMSWGLNTVNIYKKL